MKLSGRNAIITGASQGLGKTIAEHFIQEGANVALCARNESELSIAAVELAAKAQGRRVIARPCDVSNEAQVTEFVSWAGRELGAVDTLVCNAGIYGPMGPVEEIDLSEWRRAMEINVYGVLLPARALVPHFKKSAYGKIIVLSGGGATNPLPNISAYAASKAAAVRLMETLAEELRQFHVDVNAVAPGALKTRLVDQVLAAGPEKVGKAFYDKNKKWADEGATPLEFGASLCVYLASRQSDGITGKLISAQWDPWRDLEKHREELEKSDIYCLRRIVPEDRGKKW